MFEGDLELLLSPLGNVYSSKSGVAIFVWGGSWTVRELPLSFLCLTKLYSPQREERERTTKERKSKRERDRDECS